MNRLDRLESYRTLLWPAAIVLSVVLAGVAVFLPQSSPLRVLLAFWFLLVCPGMAFVRLFHLHDILVEITLAIALSIAIDTLVAEFLVLTSTWSPLRALAIVGLISLVGVALQLRQANPSLTGGQR